MDERRRNQCHPITMAKLPIFIILFLSCNMVLATEYYISNDGDDSNNGTSTFSSWKTFQHIEDCDLLPGDSAFLNRGDVWREELYYENCNGTYDSPITIGAYGTGPKPIITGADNFSDWSLHEGNIYKTTIDVPTIYQVFVDGEYYNRSSHPNNVFYNIDTITKGWIVSSEVELSEQEIIGSKAYVWSANWAIEERNVASFDEEKKNITFSTPMYYESTSKKLFYLENKLWMLDSPGEWWFNTTSKELFIWLKNNANPSVAIVEVITRNYASQITTSRNLLVHNISFLYSNYSGIKLSNSDNITVINCDINYSFDSGIRLGLSKSLLIENNFISKNFNQGIYSYIKIEKSIIKKNIITHTTMIGRAKGRSTSSISMGGLSLNNIIEYNTVINNGYAGIHFGGINNTVQYNYINNSCAILQDCGSIYTGGGNNNRSGTIRNNIIETGNSYAFGIYLDDQTGNFSAYNNTILSHPIGINIHNSRNNSIKNNVIYLYKDTSFSTNAMIRLHEDLYRPFTGFLRDNNIKYNLFFSEESLPVLYASTSGHFDFGTSDYNIFSTSDKNTHYKSGSGFNNYYTLLEWISHTGNESNSKFIDYELLDSNYFSHNKTVLVYNRFQVDKTFKLDANYTDIKTNITYDELTLQPFESKVLIPLKCNYDYHCNNEETASNCPHDCRNYCVNTSVNWFVDTLYNCTVSTPSKTDGDLILLHNGALDCDSEITAKNVHSNNGGINFKSGCKIRVTG